MSSPSADLIACHACDELHADIALGAGERAVCACCGHLLARGAHDVAARTFAWASASLVLLAVANVFPFMEFQIAGRVQVARLSTGVQLLHANGYTELAAMVAFTTIVAPLLQIGSMLLLSGAMLTGRRAGWMGSLAKLAGHVKAWSMMEVFMLGVVVSAIKLSDMAEIVFGPACFAFVVLIVTSTAAVSVFDPEALWRHLDGEDVA